MTHRRATLPTNSRQLTLLAGAAYSVMLLSGCGESAEAEQAVKASGRAFTAIALGDAEATPTDSARIYSEAEQDLAKYAGDEDGYAEAAAVGVAMAKRGQAALASHEAGGAERDSLHKGRAIRGMINEWLTMSAISQAASTFDPTEDIAELDSIIDLRQNDIKSHEQLMAKMNTEIEQHEETIARLRSQASEQRNQAGALELQIPRVSANEGADIAQQVREFTLRADQFDLEATRIEGIVGQLRPGANEVRLNVEKAAAQIELLNKAIDELRERAAASQRDADEAQEKADAALQRMNDAVSDYTDHRDSNVNSAHSKATSLIRGAINASSSAGDALKSVAAINKADAQQMLAEFQMRQATGEREEAMLYQALLEAGVPGSWQSMMDDANEAADQHFEDAKQSYQNAARSLRASRPKGEAAERINAAAERLEKLGGLEPEPEFEESSDEFLDDEMSEDEQPTHDEDEG
jgi:predicted  nucleic acid-binding Zn-ribbon protein